MHRLAYQRLGAAHEPLPVRQVLSAGIETAVDDMHEVACSDGALSPRLFDAHVPFHQTTHLPFGVATRSHTMDELRVLLLAFAVLL